MGIISIACYKPKPGKENALRELMRTHFSILHSEGLVTDRQSIMMEAKDGTIIEVFEWKSQDAINTAHNNKEVQKMWAAYGEACDYIPIAQVPEAAQLFSGFSPL